MCLVAPVENGWKLCAFFPRAAAAEWYWSTDKVFFCSKKRFSPNTHHPNIFIFHFTLKFRIWHALFCFLFNYCADTLDIVLFWYTFGQANTSKKTTWKRIASSSSGAINVKRLPTNRWFSFNIAPAHGEKPSPRRSINREKLLLLLSYYASATSLSPGL